MENNVTDSIQWIGVHFPEPAPGFSMNNFLIQDEKIAVIDTGALATAPMAVDNLKALVDPKKIDYIVITHADLDHCGGLASFLAEAPQATVITSEAEARMLGLWGVQPNIKTVSDGEVISLGKHQLRFLLAPFTCTPGSLMVYEETEGVLFSSDLFAHPGPAQWAVFSESDETEMLKMMQGVKLGNTRHTRLALEKVQSLPVKIIAPGHGQMFRSDLKRYIDSLMDIAA